MHVAEADRRKCSEGEVHRRHTLLRHRPCVYFWRADVRHEIARTIKFRDDVQLLLSHVLEECLLVEFFIDAAAEKPQNSDNVARVENNDHHLDELHHV